VQKGIIGLKATNEDSKRKVFLSQLTLQYIKCTLGAIARKILYILYDKYIL